MLVRLKKRGEFPREHSSTPTQSRVGPLGIDSFKGCCIEVEPVAGPAIYSCGGAEFEITDERVLRLYTLARLIICEHWMIDDLNAYDSDSTDEQAEIGDLAFATLPVPQEVKR